MAAPAGPGIQVEGAKELRGALKRMGADLGDMRATNIAAARPVADRAQSLVPRLTGDLAATIKPGGTRAKGYVQAGRNRTVPYAGPIHFGWPARNIAPQPFLFDALDQRRGEVVDIYAARVGELVMRVGRETP